MKKILTFLIAVALVLGTFSTLSVPARAATSGTTGDCTWTLDGTVLTISGNGAMQNYTSSSYLPWGLSITEVIIESGVTCIGNLAFSQCRSLTSVIIPDSVTYIGDEAFSYCTSLTSITIPDSITCIGYRAFSYCSSLTYHTYNNGEYLGNSNNPYMVLAGVISYSATSFQLHEDTKFIVSAFSNYTQLTSITIPDGVICISGRAFYKCSKLTSVTIPDGVTCIGREAFYSCSSLTSITIPDSVTCIGDHAFNSCSSLTSITIPDSVTSIGYSAFRNCTNLTNITIGAGSIGKNSFQGCTNLSMVTIGNSTTEIKAYAFYDCSNLNVVTIPDSVISIGVGAFGMCSALDNIVFAGNAPTFDSDACLSVTATAYYPAGNETWTEDVMQDYGGSITWVPYEVEDPKAVDEWNVSLEDDLKVNFHLNEAIAETAEVIVTVGESVNNCTISELEKDETGRYIVSVNVAAAQMNDSITLQVTNIEPVVYTVRQYCDTILADEGYSQYHQLVKEMLNYGAMAQICFNHNTDSLANAGITDVAAENVPGSTTTMSVAGTVDGISFYGASLLYRDKIAVRFYYTVTGDASDYTFTANGNACTPVLKNGKYYLEVADILPQDLEQQITLTVTDSSGNALTVSYGPMNYIVRMNEKGNDGTRNLLKALYNYHLAAKSLRTETD